MSQALGVWGRDSERLIVWLRAGELGREELRLGDIRRVASIPLYTTLYCTIT